MGRKYQLIIAGVLVFIVIPLSIFVVSGIQNLKFVPHGYVSLMSIPSPISIASGSRHAVLETNQQYSLPVGENTLFLSSTGFETMRQVVTIKKDQTVSLPVKLTPLTDAAKSEANNSKYQSTRQQISDYTMNKEVIALNKQYPILKSLPINTFDYQITPCGPDTGKKLSLCIALFIPGTDYMQKEALDAITSRGYALSDFNITIDGNAYKP